MPLADTAESWLAAHYDDLVAWRRHLHRHPELGRQEFATTQFVADRLVEAGLNPKTLPDGTGLTCDFGPEHAPRIALRADIDALPMPERTGAAYSSPIPGAAHACGHDLARLSVAQPDVSRRRVTEYVGRIPSDATSRRADDPADLAWSVRTGRRPGAPAGAHRDQAGACGGREGARRHSLRHRRRGWAA